MMHPNQAYSIQRLKPLGRWLYDHKAETVAASPWQKEFDRSYTFGYHYLANWECRGQLPCRSWSQGNCPLELTNSN
jgi:hypothetical protein